MRLPIINVGIWAFLIFGALAAWSKEDEEIFRVNAQVQSLEGPGVSFYDFLGIKPGASIAEINKGYKEKAKVLHPDRVKQNFMSERKKANKNSDVKVKKGISQKELDAATKTATKRFESLGLANKILLDERRDRYDHFLSNGFPKWRDTGYYYERFRPGLGATLVGVFAFGGGLVHWILLYSTWKTSQERLERFISKARRDAWGDNLGISSSITSGTGTPPVAVEDAESGPQPQNRRERRMQEKSSKKDKSDKKPKGSKVAKSSPAGTPPVGASGPKKRVFAENGMPLIVDLVGNVYLEQEDDDGVKQEYLLDPSENAQPTIKDTALVKVPLWAYNQTAGRFLNKASVDEAEIEEIEEEPVSAGSSGPEDFEVLEKVKTTAQNGNGKVIKRKKSSRK